MNSLVGSFEPHSCEHTSILGALIKYPQGNLEEIQ